MAAAAFGAIVALLEMEDIHEIEYLEKCMCDRPDVLTMITLSKDSKESFNHRIENYMEEDVPSYNDYTFKAHFRLSRSSFQNLMELMGATINVCTIPLETKLLASIWLLSNTESYRGVADRFGLSKGPLHYVFLSVCRALHDKMDVFVTWPTEKEFRCISNRFYSKFGMPGVIGCIDGCHIPIKGQSQNRDGYINRKGISSITLQAVCDDQLLFRDVFIGYPGSVHDARVFRNSDLYLTIESGETDVYGGHLLGDSAYPLESCLLTPFRDNGHLLDKEKRFNTIHSSTRASIERAFALLKGKFRRLKFLDMSLIQDIPKVVSAAVGLHNFIIRQTEEEQEEDIVMLVNRDACTVNRSGSAKRTAIANAL